MKSRILFSISLFLVLLVTISLPSCKTESSDTKVSSDLSTTDSDKYIVQTPLYQIYEVGLQEYRYRIGTSEKIFAEDIKHGTEPEIEEIGNGIVRLFMGFGTNAFSVQYFDIWRDRTSEVFTPFSIYADYADADIETDECLFAYFRFPTSPGKIVLHIKDIFNEQGFSTEIERDFISATCNQLIFLNEDEIYLDYDVFADGYSNNDFIAGNPVEYKNIREVVKFR